MIDILRIITVDDENTALKWFHRIASENLKVSIEGEFLYAEEAIAFVRQHPVDAAFLDIEMPEMGGFELAEKLMEIDPYINVIFITAYNQYALEAFRAHAIGYLLKPLDSEEFGEQINLLIRRYTLRPTRHHNQRLYIKCFGQFSVGTKAEGTSAIQWKTAKAEELFALLIHHQGRVKSKESLIETLWPELDPRKSGNLFRVTCTYLRHALADLGFPNLLLRELDGYKLNTDLIDCDLFRFIINPIHSQGEKSLEAVAALYSGEYLEGKSYDWASAAKTQMESDFKRLQYCLADKYFANGQVEKVCEAMEKILLYDPCEEAAVIRIIQAKLQAGDRATAIKVYKKFVKMLKAELGVLPSAKFQQLIPDDMR